MNPQCGKRILDCTLGMGGHSAAFLEAGSDVVGVDRDPEARTLAQHRLAAYGDRFQVAAGSFASVTKDMVANGERFDAVLADLGVSSWQLDADHRGFGIRSEVEADMRMGDDCDETALDLIRRLDADALADIIFQFGERAS